jgi:hypothetical protein
MNQTPSSVGTYPTGLGILIRATTDESKQDLVAVIVRRDLVQVLDDFCTRRRKHFRVSFKIDAHERSAFAREI